jgi:adenylate kinase family enzyme
VLRTFIFIGRSGCGKGTQAALLKDHVHKRDHSKKPILYIETGDRFRNFIRQDSYTASLSREMYDRDERQPDFLAGYMWASELVESFDKDMHLVFDGAPRSQAEARLLTTAMKFYKREEPTVIYINVSVKWSEQRLLARGRQDDKTLVKIDKRLAWFEEETLPAIDYFRTNNLYKFVEVNGEQPVEKVFDDILQKIEKN